jgi:putative DNA primase/helicase
MISLVSPMTYPELPEPLTRRDQWVLWRCVRRGGKSTKVPYQTNGKTAKTDDSQTWNAFDVVLGAWSKASARYQGIGFVFADSDEFAGIDLDNCIDDQGRLKDWVRPVIEQFRDTYSEISPSARGIKIWAVARLNGVGRRVVHIRRRPSP